MARFAEVSVAPAEPLGDVAAEFALELDEVCPVDFALGSAHSQSVGCAFTTDQLLCLEFLFLLLRSQAVLQSSEVWILTSMAQVVGALEDCKLGYVVVVGIAWVLKSRVFVKSFMLGPFNSHLLHLLLLTNEPFVVWLDLRVWVREGHLLFAGGAIQEIKRHSRGRPPLGHYAEDTVDVENMLATQYDRWLVPKSRELADAAVRSSMHALKLLVVRTCQIVVLDAGLVETAKTL